MLRCSNSYIAEEIPIEEENGHKAYTVGKYDTDNPQTIHFEYKEYIGTHILYRAIPSCSHMIKASMAGGIKCIKCGGWFCC